MGLWMRRESWASLCGAMTWQVVRQLLFICINRFPIRDSLAPSESLAFYENSPGNSGRRAVVATPTTTMLLEVYSTTDGFPTGTSHSFVYLFISRSTHRLHFDKLVRVKRGEIESAEQNIQSVTMTTVNGEETRFSLRPIASRTPLGVHRNLGGYVLQFPIGHIPDEEENCDDQ